MVLSGWVDLGWLCLRYCVLFEGNLSGVLGWLLTSDF